VYGTNSTYQPRQKLRDVAVPEVLTKSNTAHLNPIDNLGSVQLLSDSVVATKDNTMHLNSTKETNHLTDILNSILKPASTPTIKRKQKLTRNRHTPNKPLSSTNNNLKQVTLTKWRRLRQKM